MPLLAHNPTFDGLVADLRMPGIDGLDLLHSAAARYPGMVRLVLSGFAPSLSIFGILSHAHGFFVKPCDPRILAADLGCKLALREKMANEELRNLVFGME